MRRAALLGALLLGAACTHEPPAPLPSADAGHLEDAGTGTDAGTWPDAGPGCGVPPAVTGRVLLPGLNNPRRLAADATDVYVSESGSLNPTQAQGRLLRLPRVGGPLTVLATGLQAPDALGLDADAVYLVDGQGLWRVDKATGQKARLDATASNVIAGGTEVLVSGNVVVLATGLERLVRVGRDGAGRLELYKGPAGTQVRGARLVGGEVWFLVSSPAPEVAGLYRVPLDGLSAAERVDASVVAGRSLEVTDTHLLVAEAGASGTGRLRLLPRAGGEPLTLADNLAGPAHPVLLNDTVYFKDTSASGDGFFRQVRLCAPGTVSPVGPTGAGPGALLLDGTSLLFTSQENGTGGYLGRVP